MFEDDMVMNDLKQAIEDVGRRLEGKKCLCPNVPTEQQCKACQIGLPCLKGCVCNGTGLDPQYDPLRELFRVKCWQPHLLPELRGMRHASCAEAGCLGYVPRLDLAETEGALKGSIEEAVINKDGVASDFYKKWFMKYNGYKVVEKLTTNLAATRAVKESIG